MFLSYGGLRLTNFQFNVWNTFNYKYVYTNWIPRRVYHKGNQTRGRVGRQMGQRSRSQTHLILVGNDHCVLLELNLALTLYFECSYIEFFFFFWVRY